MKWRNLLLATSLMLTVPAFGAVKDDDITAAAKNYEKLFADSRDAGDRPGMADMGDFVDKAFAKIPVDELTLEQVRMIINSVPVQMSTKTSKALDAYLVKIAAGKDADAGRAAMWRLNLLPTTSLPADRLPLLTAALDHPSVHLAAAKGSVGAAFIAAQEQPADVLAKLAPKLVNLKDDITGDAPTSFYDQGAAFMMALPKTLDAAGVKTYGPLRQSLATAVTAKLKGTVTETEKTRLEKDLSQLNGAWARAELVGFPAPELHFDAFIDPANPERVIKTLSDLKGKVVVLDFWATWCGPCVVSFPKVKALNHYYRGYDVVIIGVTSLQGFSTTATGRIDTAGDPKKEYGLMPDFMKEHDMVWPVVFSTEPVFNPDYGVTGIPDVVIIDTKGIVRYAGLHPAMPLEEKTPMIDKLLGEGGRVVPSLLMMSKPKPVDSPTTAPAK